jgi:hypothetical protein|tara:strand:+ start:19824 stop:19979 length:156 start_codon:yes stop_codon:yes gene_type:complete
MYEILTRNRKVERSLYDYISQYSGVFDKLRRLKMNPKKECGAHPLHGKFKE